MQYIEIDTAHFKGNFPESCEVFATTDINADKWTQVLPRTKLGPHRQHYFLLQNVRDAAYTHVKIIIHPDGGIKRIRVIGTLQQSDNFALPADVPNIAPVIDAAQTPILGMHLPILPLTPEAFAPFGQVVAAYRDHGAAPKGTKITPANFGSASKFHKLSLLDSDYPTGSGATTGLSVYHCKPTNSFQLTHMERHAHTNQAFIPMGGEGRGYLVVVAQTGSDGKPDLKTLRAFKASPSQGIVYNKALWHQPMTVLDEMDFTCVETQVGDGSVADCEILALEDPVELKL